MFRNLPAYAGVYQSLPGLAALIRDLLTDYRTNPVEAIALKWRTCVCGLVCCDTFRHLACRAYFLCTASMFSLLLGQQNYARLAFAGALLFMLFSLALALAEIHLSVRALNIEVSSLDALKRQP